MRERIVTSRLSLVAMDTDVLSALARGAPAHAASLLQVQIGDECDLSAELAQLRLAQLRSDPGLGDWLLRTIIRRSDSVMIGHIGFHSRPDPDYLRDLAPGAVEIGYTVYAPYRRNGYAIEAVSGLMEWASSEHDVTSFVASVSPENAPSVGLIHKLGFHKIGRFVDPVDGPEDIYLLQVDLLRVDSL
jgi:[ribosomal protein S5]-alanine N-acetyltransferase